MTGWLIDKSALVRLAASPEAQEWADRIQRGLVRISTIRRSISESLSTSPLATESKSRASD